MIKRIMTFVVTSSIISAGLLYLGITIMDQYSPALASSLNPLVARTDKQISQSAVSAADGLPLSEELNSAEKNMDASPLPKSASNFQVDSNPSLKAPSNSVTAKPSGADVTIAQLIQNPNQFIHQVITIVGIATMLGDDKFLLNDGTGQILVEIEDNLGSYTVTNGQSITVMGKLDDPSSQSSLELDACTLTDQIGTVVINNCIDDDDIDDNDDDMDDDDDDIDDDDDDIDDDDDDVDDDDDDVDDDDDDGDDVDEDNDDDDDD